MHTCTKAYVCTTSTHELHCEPSVGGETMMAFLHYITHTNTRAHPPTPHPGILIHPAILRIQRQTHTHAQTHLILAILIHSSILRVQRQTHTQVQTHLILAILIHPAILRVQRHRPLHPRQSKRELVNGTDQTGQAVKVGFSPQLYEVPVCVRVHVLCVCVCACAQKRCRA